MFGRVQILLCDEGGEAGTHELVGALLAGLGLQVKVQQVSAITAVGTALDNLIFSILILI